MAQGVYPVLLYRDAMAAIEWLERAFGFERLMVQPGPDGSVMHAELRCGSSVVMLSTASGNGTPNAGLAAAPSQLVYVAVDDPDARYERAKAAGAEVTREIHDTSYGSRDFMVRDPQGHEWAFGTYRPEV